MILGNKNVFLRHVFVGGIALVFILIFFFLHLKYSHYQNAFLRAFADTAFIFLFITLSIGPLTVLWQPAIRILTWRREFGIWFAILALFHGLLTASFLFKWNVISTISQGGLGLSNLMGMTALLFALTLAATSSDRAVQFLGITSWKWLHYSSYVIFYLVAFHGIYNLFMGYNTHWFKYLFLIMVFGIPILQLSAFIKIVYSNRKRLKEAKQKNGK
ncbi:MAG: ferric reductase-like transmembrane domain-containing protein [Candidatus Pacearchaeota archaeon]